MKSNNEFIQKKFNGKFPVTETSSWTLAIDRFRDIYSLTLEAYDTNRNLNIFLGQAITEVECEFKSRSASIIIKTMIRDEAIDVNLRKLVFRSCPRCHPNSNAL